MRHFVSVAACGGLWYSVFYIVVWSEGFQHVQLLTARKLFTHTFMQLRLKGCRLAAVCLIRYMETRKLKKSSIVNDSGRRKRSTQQVQLVQQRRPKTKHKTKGPTRWQQQLQESCAPEAKSSGNKAAHGTPMPRRATDPAAPDWSPTQTQDSTRAPNTQTQRRRPTTLGVREAPQDGEDSPRKGKVAQATKDKHETRKPPATHCRNQRGRNTTATKAAAQHMGTKNGYRDAYHPQHVQSRHRSQLQGNA